MEHTLGRLVDHDPASRNFAHFASTQKFVKKTTRWTTHAPVLDQGQLGSCTGNAMAQWLNTDYARAAALKKPTDPYQNETDAVRLYSKATHLDGIAGNTYPPTDGGSSGLGVAKAAKAFGEIKSYHWTFSLNAFLATLQLQPVIVGTIFYADMENPDKAGVMHPGGDVAGGHEYLMLGVDYSSGLLEMENSWSDQWGVRGHAYISITDFGRLLVDQQMPGDVTAPSIT